MILFWNSMARAAFEKHMECYFCSFTLAALSWGHVSHGDLKIEALSGSASATIARSDVLRLWIGVTAATS